MTVMDKGHITDTALEDYSLDHLAEPELEIVEEHILICPTCQDRLAEVDDFVRAFRMAHEDLEAGESGGGGTRLVSLDAEPVFESALPRYAPPPSWFQKPAVWAGLGFMVVAAVAVPFWLTQRHAKSASPMLVSLVAQRGANSSADAREGRLTLQLDLQGVNDDPLVIEVATWDGQSVWQRTIGQAEARASITPDVDFTAGQYWVRVRAEHDPTLLREFGLRVAKP